MEIFLVFFLTLAAGTRAAGPDSYHLNALHCFPYETKFPCDCDQGDVPCCYNEVTDVCYKPASWGWSLWYPCMYERFLCNGSMECRIKYELEWIPSGKSGLPGNRRYKRDVFILPESSPDKRESGRTGRVKRDISYFRPFHSPLSFYPQRPIFKKECRPYSGNYWGPWMPTSMCTEQCQEGTQTEERKCFNQARMEISPSQCNGNATRVRRCNNLICEKYSEWMSGGCVTPDNRTCGMGQEVRERVCLRPCGRIPESCLRTNASCNMGPCEFGYGNFTEWSNCSCQCRPGEETRVGICIFFANLTLSTLCGPPNITERRPCNTGACNNFSPWAPNSQCSVTCGTGIKNETRTCMDNPPPALPEYCTKRMVPCLEGACLSNNSVYGNFTVWAGCNGTCTPGVESRTGICIFAATLMSSTGCNPLTITQYRPCNNDSCLTYGPWMNVSSCSHACDGGMITQNRTCITYSNGMVALPQNCTTRSSSCNNQACPTPSVSVYGNFSVWSNCSCSCHPGTQNRTGFCIFNDTLQASTQCSNGTTITETRVCNNNTCNVYTIWTPTTTCNETTGLSQNTRTCVEISGSGVIPAYCLSQLRACSSDRVAYSNFTAYTQCNETCFPGYQSRTGICLFVVNMTAATGCDPALATEFRQCNTMSCNTYSPWVNGSCSVACGDGFLLRTRNCTAYSAGVTSLPTACVQQNFSCAGPPCQQYTPFSNYTACNSTCSRGSQSRFRECRNVLTNALATGCGGPDNDTEFRDCNTDLCSSYSSYVNSSCTRDCDGESIRSTRTCLGNGTIPAGCGIINYNCTTPLPSDPIMDILVVIDDTTALDGCGTSLIGLTPATRVEPLKNTTLYPNFNRQRQFLRDFFCRYKEVGLGTNMTRMSIMSHQGNCEIFNRFNETTLNTIDNLPADCGAIDFSGIGGCWNPAFANTGNPQRASVNNTVIYISPDLSNVAQSNIGGWTKARNLLTNIEYFLVVSAVTEGQISNPTFHFAQLLRLACFHNPPPTACENYLGTIFDSMDVIFARLQNITRLFDLPAPGQVATG